MREKPFAFGPLRVGLASKLILLLVVSTVALFSFFGYLNIRLQERHAEELILQDADHVGDVILRSLRFQMLRNDRESLYQVIANIGAQPGIRGIRILNGEGRIAFSSDPAEINAVVNKKAEACQDCHADSDTLRKPLRPNHSHIFVDAHGQRVLGVIRAVQNEPACSNAICHIHPPGQQVLGIIDTTLSLVPVTEQIAAQKAELVRFTVVVIATFSLLSALFIWKVVERPLKELVSGIQKVTAGDVGFRLQVRSRDEFGEFASSFNRMTESLARAQQENIAWGRTLEKRVEQKTGELESAQRTILAREKMASIGKLAATVAHEVNNPLAGILTYAGLTLKKLNKLSIDPVAQEAMRANLQTIERESRRCGDLMRNLLAFSRQTPSQRAPRDLNLLIKDGLALVRHQMDLQGVETREQLQDGLPPVLCDAGQIRQVILALLVNAAQAMPGGGHLEVSTSLDAGRQAVVVRLRDTGVGIPSQILPHIFDPFFTTKDTQQNTGLGLAVAHSILQQHGGEISANSTPGQGSEFIVSLPVHAPVSPSAVLASQEKG
jgi:two-component system NtrC family sensor kinase